MAKKINKIKVEKSAQEKPAAGGKESAPQPQQAPWIQMKTGLYVLGAASIVMVVLTIWESIRAGLGFGSGLLYGLIFAAVIWAVFIGSQLFFRWLRR
jgi:hypothetical protein